MAVIRSTREIADKWKRVVPARVDDYRTGVEKPLRDWEAGATAAGDAWRGGVETAITEDRFRKGVRKAGTKKWSAKATAVGPRRWSEGVSIASPAYEAGFGPFRDTIERTELPEKYPKGDPRNLERVRKMAAALHEQKIALLG